MGSLSSVASNAIIWPTYIVMLVSASAIAYWKHDSKTFLSANGSQRAVPLALNFIASGVGCSVLVAYPEMANVAGLQGLLVYALTSALPMYVFAVFGPQIKKKCPNGFMLTEWVFQRYGTVAGLYLSACTILTLFLFMVSEIASLKQAVETLTKGGGLAVVIVECVVTTIYTTIGGFNISFITDSLQTLVFLFIWIISAIAFGCYVKVDRSLIEPSGLLKPTRLGWQLIYILTVAIFTNDFFLSGFWLRTFAAKSDKDLLIGCSLAAGILVFFFVVVGFTGILAVWGGYVPIGSEDPGSAFFVLLSELPSWIMGLVLTFVLVLSTCTLDSLQSALVSTISNDLFKNKLPLMYTRAIVGIVMIPVVIVGLIATDVLTIFLIVDLLSSAVVPVLMLGLWSKMDFLTAWEIIGGGLGGLFCVFLFGTAYYGNTRDGGRLLLISDGLYKNDWGAFGAMVAAPFGSLLVGFSILAIRSAVIYLRCRTTKKPFTVFTRKIVYHDQIYSKQDDVSITSKSPRGCH
ncbi:uncharacterized protein Ecym_7216 [Eremothecium cymbalariae DBVPG|uniref:Urea transport protein n=1 Tax=Eremothecium cymbalariae (strain CBS 270.75 / DBVPG 7215 / KCTC 17166 / NRRL Y-17582) TaxID=931890 RepID=G8JW47_ERECY|nr:hypothetical protein Ecym_7216 [Eremothecium cymbalariae DBVPG\